MEQKDQPVEKDKKVIEVFKVSREQLVKVEQTEHKDQKEIQVEQILKGNNNGQKGATGANADSFWTGNKSGEVGPGWVSLVDFHSNRGHADVYAWDNNSSRHSFIQIKATRHYTHANANVVAYSGYTKHITAFVG